MGDINITQEHAARRFQQVNVIERQVVMKDREVAACEADLKGLKEERAMLLARLRMAARDEGDLPLFSDLEDD